MEYGCSRIPGRLINHSQQLEIIFKKFYLIFELYFTDLGFL